MGCIIALFNENNVTDTHTTLLLSVNDRRKRGNKGGLDFRKFTVTALAKSLPADISAWMGGQATPMNKRLPPHSRARWVFKQVIKF